MQNIAKTRYLRYTEAPPGVKEKILSEIGKIVPDAVPLVEEQFPYIVKFAVET
jgi:hypothetical protein